MSIVGPILLDGLLRSENMDWRSTDILIGHLGLLPIEQQASIVSSTCVRDPRAHFQSLYQHVKRTPEHWGHDTILKEELSFEDWLAHDAFRELLDNPQSRYLSIAPQLPHGQFDRTNPARWQTGFETQVCVAHDDDLYSDAITTLERMHFVGTTETLHSLSSQICRYFNVKQLPLPHENKGVSKPLSRRAESLIEERAGVDLAVYEFARSLTARASNSRRAHGVRLRSQISAASRGLIGRSNSASESLQSPLSLIAGRFKGLGDHLRLHGGNR